MPQIIYPYNEILPTKRAHDVFIYNECAHLARLGFDVTLLCGKGSGNLSSHYQAPDSPNLHIKQLPILRRNNFLRLNANLPFFFFSQCMMKKMRPDIVILSVWKQGKYHLKRKIPGIKYVYEVHALDYYPNIPFDPAKVQSEKKMLAQADLIVTTTEELTNILQNPPYQFSHVKTLPLAVSVSSLPSPTTSSPFTLGYVGQLYKAQGINLLLEALALTPFHLKIIGGKQQEISQYQKECERLHIGSRVSFLGFHPPSMLSSALTDVHAFVAPFESYGKMRFVAHTKIMEYIDWKRPVIVPNLPVVKECFPHDQAVSYFTVDDPQSLALAMTKTYENYPQLLKEVPLEKRFTWENRVTTYQKLLSDLL